MAKSDANPKSSTSAKKEEGKKKSPVVLILIIVGGICLLCCVVTVVGFVVFRQRTVNLLDDFSNQIGTDFGESFLDELNDAIDENDSSSSSSSSSLYDNTLPTSVPTYPGATVTYSYEEPDTGYRSTSFGVSSTDTVAEVLAFFESELPLEGWIIDDTFSFEDTIFADLGSLQLTMTVLESTNGVTYSIIVNESNL